MFNVNVAAVAKMTKMERVSVESMYLNLMYLKESEVRVSGSRAMRRSPEEIVMERNNYSFAERQAVNSFKELFHISSDIYKRTGLRLIGFVTKEDKTPTNAIRTWRKLYLALSVMKTNSKAVL